jgi:F0F1-type ATP synthase assembly protein I
MKSGFPGGDKQSDVWAQVAYYTGLGFILPAGLAVGYALGWGLDRWLHTSPALAVVMAVAGAAGGFIELLRILARAERDGSGNGSSGGPGAS